MMWVVVLAVACLCAGFLLGAMAMRQHLTGHWLPPRAALTSEETDQ